MQFALGAFVFGLGVLIGHALTKASSMPEERKETYGGGNN